MGGVLLERRTSLKRRHSAWMGTPTFPTSTEASTAAGFADHLRALCHLHPLESPVAKTPIHRISWATIRLFFAWLVRLPVNRASSFSLTPAAPENGHPPLEVLPLSPAACSSLPPAVLLDSGVAQFKNAHLSDASQ